MKLIIICIIKFIALLIPLLIAIAFLTLFERKIIASMQQRKGPNVVGFLGLMQPIADGLKLLLKETMLPSFASSLLFLLSPVITFTCALSLWYIIPFNYFNFFLTMQFGILYIFILSSLSVYGLIFAGWSSNSKYAFLGGLRSSAQMISYEVSFGLTILNVALWSDSLSLLDIIEAQQDIWFIFPLFNVFCLFIISALAETNRTPFDLPEAEGELVAGYNVEYSALTFALFFLAEYSNIIFMSVLATILFLGGWYIPGISEDYLLDMEQTIYFIISIIIFSIKVLFFMFLFIWIRAVCPRYRYDQLMELGWKVLLPISLGTFLFNSGYLTYIYCSVI